LRIPRVDTAVDAGLVVTPEVTRSQFEGAAIFGTSKLAWERSLPTGVDQSNFDSYPVSQINEAPYQTNVYIVENGAPLAGVGKPPSRRSRPVVWLKGRTQAV
jgi:isoquinoline 1-oxidoreductase beta subunit